MYELTFKDQLVDASTANWARILLAADVDLESGRDSFFYFAVHDPTVSESSYRVGTVKLDKTFLITLLQQSAIGELALMSGMESDLKPSGVYDCETAQYMSIIAAYIRGTAVQHEAWAVGPEDVFFLLARNTYFQVSVNDALRNAGYEGATGQNGIPLIYRDWSTYQPPTIPSDCGFDKDKVGGGVESGPPEGFENVGYSDVAQSKFPTAAVGAVVGAAAALVGAALLGKRGR